MKKSTFIKRIVALLLVVLMSIDAFAAVVGDNDGAAFITKAEFDSMKNDFQSQLDRYNSSIDNKIDGAIAGYLNGIRVAKQTNLKPLISNYENMRWVNGFFGKMKKRSFTAETTYTDMDEQYYTYDWSDSDLVEYKLESPVLSTLGINYQQNKWYHGKLFLHGDAINTDGTISVNLPVFPQQKLGLLKTKHFLHNNRCIEIGGGMPLVEKVQQSGNILLRFNYKNLTKEVGAINSKF